MLWRSIYCFFLELSTIWHSPPEVEGAYVQKLFWMGALKMLISSQPSAWQLSRLHLLMWNKTISGPSVEFVLSASLFPKFKNELFCHGKVAYERLWKVGTLYCIIQHQRSVHEWNFSATIRGIPMKKILWTFVTASEYILVTWLNFSFFNTITG